MSQEFTSVNLQKIDSLRIPFIQNNGQIDDSVKYYANTFAGTVFVTNDSLVYNVSEISDDVISEVSVRETFVNFGGMIPKEVSKSDSTVNYFVGDKSNWQTNVSTYNSVDLGSCGLSFT